MAKLRIDLTGRVFGKLTVKELFGRKEGKAKWLCMCECGEETVAFGYNLSNGHTTSCGCHRYDTNEAVVTHGKSKTRAHGIWRSLRQRCLNENNPAYPRYGGRGIKICERWSSFENFYADMGDPPEGYSIERIDVDGNYEPSNCKWADDLEQARNKRTSVRVTIGGVTKTLVEWCQERGVSYSTALLRMKRGIANENLFDPPRKRLNSAGH